jgi:hypothetical protein
MTLADALPSPDAGQMFTVICGVGALMGFYWLGRQIYLSHCPVKADPKDQDRFVTHGFLDQRLLELKNEVTTKLQESKVEMLRVETSVRDLDREFSQKFDKQEKYLHDSFHRLGNSQGQVQNDMSYVRGVMETMLKHSGGRPRRRRPPAAEEEAET